MTTNPHSTPTPPRSRGGLKRSSRVFVVVAIGLGILAIGWWLRFVWYAPEARARRLLAEAQVLAAAGDAAGAERAASDALAFDAGLLEAALLSAELNHRRLDRLSAAEHGYRAVLKIEPDHVAANRGLAELLGLCARRREAIPHVLRLVRQGEPTDLLVLLARESGVVADRSALERARRAEPDDPNPLIGLAWHAAEDERPDVAIEYLREALRLAPDLPAAHAALGVQLSAAGRQEELIRWSAQLPSSAETFPEVWLVRGEMAESAGDPMGAIRCFREAARLAPESKHANVRLSRLLAAVDRPVASAQFTERVRRLQDLEELQNRVLFSGDLDSVEPLLEMADRYAAAGRHWEAYGWCLIAVEADAAHTGARRSLAEARRRAEPLPLRLTVDAANPAAVLDLPAAGQPVEPLPSGTRTDDVLEAAGMEFHDEAADRGLHFRYFSGTDDANSRRMFELTGGGVGVLDLEPDGDPDMYFTQGRQWPPDTPSQGSGDRLFRNHGGVRFEDVTAAAGIREDQFGQGISVGDVNADGFDDLYVSNIGSNHLWFNNGDGTFYSGTPPAMRDAWAWTTSCVLADLDGDGLCDAYDVNYLQGPDLFDRICRGTGGAPRMCMPFDFDAEQDRLWLNDAVGGFRDATSEVLGEVPAGKGLGALAWDADASGRLSLFVANDTTPGHFFVPSAGPGILRERGIESGLALNGEGKATGCMGIALGDVDSDGRFDVHVTNFLNEPNTLWINVAPGFYEDRTRELGLRGPSLGMLGFGTQFLDVDLDGRLELFVSNGHIDDLRDEAKPYRMPAQLFRWDGTRFTEIDRAGLGPYFLHEWLGRAVARLDWNGDGAEDLVVGHLADDVALLTNRTRETGRFISLRLFGVESNRDAIGTTVEALIGRQRIVRQMTAGDGYQASNERRLILGVGAAPEVDELMVRWPSGRLQRFCDVPSARSFLLVEGSGLVEAPPAAGR